MAKDFLLARMTGEFCSDAWSAKGLVHLRTGEPPSEYYALLNVPERLAPSILPPHAVAGTVAEATGLRAGIPVVTGWSDALCGMAGTGSLGEEGVAFNLTGTSEITGASSREPRPGLLHVPGFVTGDASVLYGPSQSGGDSLTWFAEWTASGRVEAVVEAAEATPAGRRRRAVPTLPAGRACAYLGFFGARSVRRFAPPS